MSRSIRIQLNAGHAVLAAATALGLTMFGPSTALAQSSEVEDQPSSQLALGVGAVSIQKVYRDIDPYNIALPVVSYESKWFSIGIPRVDLKLYSPGPVSLRLRARYAGDGYDDGDSRFLAGMDERKRSTWVGGAFIWNNDVANVSVEVLGDAMGNSRGTRANIQVDRRFGFGAFGLTPRLGVGWYDSKFVDYYYGVKGSEATAVRSAYQGDSTTAAEAGLRLDYSPSRHHTMFVDFGITRFGSAIKESPIVEKATQTSVALGYLYRF